MDHDTSFTETDGDRNKIRQISLQKKTDSDSETSADENEQLENGMMFIRHRSDSKVNMDTSIKDRCDNYISSFHHSSDSENEDGAMEKLASAIGHLFTGYFSLFCLKIDIRV